MADKDTVIGVRLPRDVRNRLRKKGKQEDRTLSSMARVYIERGLREDGVE